jgi:putative tryptophan/tyrosine transport system substrate-binding protein
LSTQSYLFCRSTNVAAGHEHDRTDDHGSGTQRKGSGGAARDGATNVACGGSLGPHDRCIGTPPAFAAKRATSTIPIVINVGIDPVQVGLVASLNRPGGNVTGLALLTAELGAKRLELLHESLPAATVVAMLVNPTSPITEPETRGVRDAARSLGLQLHVLNASTESEIDRAFGTLVELRAGALVVSVDVYLNNQRAQIVALAARHAVPAIYGVREFATSGGLMSYGNDLADAYRQSGIYAAKILKSEKPADLPVQQVVRVEFVINLKTAKTLGLTFPLPLIGRADEVIE